MKRTAVLGRTRRRGLTLLELIIATGIMTVLMGMALSVYLFLLKQEKRNLSSLLMVHDSMKLQRELRRHAAGASDIRITGNTVEFTGVDGGAIARLSYVDDDGDPTTIEDNRVVFDPNAAVDDDESTIVRYASPLMDGETPRAIFRRGAGNPSPLLVEFRIGDRTGPLEMDLRAFDEHASRDDGFTGQGIQTFVVSAAYFPRN